ncbi:hypothetical protein B0H13DRAFT_1539043, partial [Mycena leptocephala]
LGIAYGINVFPVDDPYITLSDQAIQLISAAAVPGRFFVDSIPILKYIPEWMPGAGFQKTAREGRALARDLLERPFAETKRQL